MRILVLGGTVFLGRHFVEAALARGHEITLFNRGLTDNPFKDFVHSLVGERDPDKGAGLAALAQGQWDAVLDTSGFVPRHVAASCAALAGRTGHYIFVSSVSAYADLSVPGIEEHAPLATLADPASEDIQRDYGALKARCEQLVVQHFGKRALIVRPGLIIGPHDPTDRFAYWAARFGDPTLLGTRGNLVVMPAPADRPIQCIDARDIVGWLLQALQAHRNGTFNLTSPPGLWTMSDLAQCGHRLAARRGFDLSVRWLDDTHLLAHGVTPWTGLPLWIPLTDTQNHGLALIDVQRALDTGLTVRALQETLTDTVQWLIQTPRKDHWKMVLDGQLEESITQLLPV